MFVCLFVIVVFFFLQEICRFPSAYARVFQRILGLNEVVCDDESKLFRCLYMTGGRDDGDDHVCDWQTNKFLILSFIGLLMCLFVMFFVVVLVCLSTKSADFQVHIVLEWSLSVMMDQSFLDVFIYENTWEPESLYLISIYNLYNVYNG